MKAVGVVEDAQLVTGEELMSMGLMGSYELIDGRIVPMTPAGEEHGLIEFKLGAALMAHVRSRRLGRVAGGEVGIYTRRNPDRVRGADIVFISTDRANPEPEQGFLRTAPDLVVEITSPNDRWQDIQEKIEEYFAIGVRWVWIVEPTNRVVRVYRAVDDVQRLGEDDVLAGEGVLTGFLLPVKSLFDYS